MKTELFSRYPALKVCEKDIDAALQLMRNTYKSGGTIYVCGNGGSCSDSDHIVGELMKGFLLRRELTCEQKKKFTDMFPEDADMAENSREQYPLFPSQHSRQSFPPLPTMWIPILFMRSLFTDMRAKMIL